MLVASKLTFRRKYGRSGIRLLVLLGDFKPLWTVRESLYITLVDYLVLQIVSVLYNAQTVSCANQMGLKKVEPCLSEVGCWLCLC